MTTNLAPTAASQSPLPSAQTEQPYWGAAQAVLWVVFAVGVLVWLRKQIVSLVDALTFRLRSGGSVKIGAMELGSIYVAPGGDALKGSEIEAAPDSDSGWLNRRQATYRENGNVFLVHRLYPSKAPGQLYDIRIYLVPHKTDLEHIGKVEYYFGPFWGSQIFSTTDREKSFAIATSAYGAGFLCLARVFDRDLKSSFDTWRYVDFEAGEIGVGRESVQALESVNDFHA